MFHNESQPILTDYDEVFKRIIILNYDSETQIFLRNYLEKNQFTINRRHSGWFKYFTQAKQFHLCGIQFAC